MSATAYRVPAALLLARWWSRPTVEELESWDALWEPAAETGLALGIDPAVVERLREAACASDRERLADEYERLMVGPGRAPCQPYESLWRSDLPDQEQGALMGPPADEVQSLYSRLGMRVRDGAHELPDHLLIEWEALACALEQEAGEAAESLLHDHLGRWMTPFCAAVGAATEEPFYSVLAELTPAWTAALRA